MSSRISIGRPLESTRRPVELLYRTSPRAEDLAECAIAKKSYKDMPEKNLTKNVKNTLFNFALTHYFPSTTAEKSQF